MPFVGRESSSRLVRGVLCSDLLALSEYELEDAEVDDEEDDACIRRDRNDG